MQKNKDLLSIDFKVNERTQSVISCIKEKIPKFMRNTKDHIICIQEIENDIKEYAKNKRLNNRNTIESIQERIITGLISMLINKTYNNIRSDMQNTKSIFIYLLNYLDIFF